MIAALEPVQWSGGFHHGVDWTGQDLSGWLCSEKLRGWRTIWTGSRYITRSGAVLEVPAEWLANMPALPLDGELWLGRLPNEGPIRSAVARGDYSQLQFCIFDIPREGLRFEQAQAVIAELPLPDHCRRVEQVKVGSTADALEMMQAVVRAGGEGCMLRRPGSRWHPWRHPSLLKLKPA